MFYIHKTIGQFAVSRHVQVVMVRHNAERGNASVLINPMDYALLELYTLDDRTMKTLRLRTNSGK